MNKKFKRLVSFLILLIICFTMVLIPLKAAAYNTYEKLWIVFNGEILDLDVNPIMVNDRILVPVRGICEALGANVKWDNENRKITVNKEDKIIILQVDNKKAIVNGKEIDLDVPAKIINGRTLIPARFVSENLECDINYKQGTAIITSRDFIPDGKLGEAMILIKNGRYAEATEKLYDEHLKPQAEYNKHEHAIYWYACAKTQNKNDAKKTMENVEPDYNGFLNHEIKDFVHNELGLSYEEWKEIYESKHNPYNDFDYASYYTLEESLVDLVDTGIQVLHTPIILHIKNGTYASEDLVQRTKQFFLDRDEWINSIIQMDVPPELIERHSLISAMLKSYSDSSWYLISAVNNSNEMEVIRYLEKYSGALEEIANAIEKILLFNKG